MANINWGLVSNLGANIPTEGRGWNKPYDTEGFSKSFQEGMNTLGGLFDRFNREKAIGGMYSNGLMAARAKCQKLASKLRELQAELREAQAYEQQGMARPADEVIRADAARGMQGYASPAGTMLGYRPGTEQERAYDNAYAMLGAMVPNVRM